MNGNVNENIANLTYLYLLLKLFGVFINLSRFIGNSFCKKTTYGDYITILFNTCQRKFLLRFAISVSLFFVCTLSHAQTNSFFNNSQSLTKSFEENNFYAISESGKEKNDHSDFQYTEFASCVANATGNWNDASIWSCGHAPGPGDDVTIPNGVTVTITDNTSACQNITINNNGSLVVGGSFNLDVNGDWKNNGSLDAGTGTVTFKGTPGTTTTISGSSPTAFYNIIIDKGNDVNSIVEANGSGAISNTGTLTINNGLFKMTTGSFQFGGSSGPAIPSTGGIWIAGGSFSSGNYSITNNGLIRISAGTANFGTNAGNNVLTQNDGSFEVSNGTVNIAGALENTASGGPLTGLTSSGVTISGGVINLANVGNGTSNIGSFDMSQSSTVNITGGTITFQNPSAASAPVDLFIVAGGTKSITGGVFQFGTNAGTYRIDAGIDLYNVTVNANSSVQLVSATSNSTTYAYDLSITNQLTLNDHYN